MKQARDTFPQLGNNLWTGSPPAEAKVPARFAGPGPAISRAAPSTEGTLGAAERSPRRGGGQEAALEAKQPGASRARGRGGFERGRASARKRRPLQQAHPRAHDRRCPSSTDRDNGQSPRSPHGLSSYLVACPAKADLVLNRGSSVGVATARMVTPLVTMSGEASTSLGNQRPPGSRRSGVVLADRIGRKQGALGRESALPLTGWRAEAVLVLPLSVGSQIP
jgi:hypothetical protein